MFESKSGILLIAGIGFFSLAFLSNGLVPWLMYSHLETKSVEQMIQDQKGQSFNILSQMKLMREQYKDQFEKYYPKDEKTNDDEICAKMLRAGHKVYVAEACWHCHSQFVRPVSNEEKRWGNVSKSIEYQNELQMPVMFGTRRVGPDLTREGGRRSNDWHAVHLFNPRDTSPRTVMPRYPWLFDGNQGAPNERGLGLILYMQWLNSWSDNYPYRDDDLPTR